LTISVVTSCSLKGWDEYGASFVSSFAEHWPANVRLYVVSEDLNAGKMSVPVSPRLEFIDLWERSAEAAAFAYRHENNARARGKELIPTFQSERHVRRIREKGYDFRFDAYKFAKKVFAIEIVANLVGSGRLFWVDADVVTFAPVKIEMLERLLPAGVALSCLDRDNYHSECGFVGYNLDHPAARNFVRDFSWLYSRDEVFELVEWHDSFVFDWLRQMTKVPTHKIPHLSRKHPFVNSELGRVMDHFKGARKDAGRTPKQERLVKDGVSYWS
jgi:hypothetical protein